MVISTSKFSLFSVAFIRKPTKEMRFCLSNVGIFERIRGIIFLSLNVQSVGYGFVLRICNAL